MALKNARLHSPPDALSPQPECGTTSIDEATVTVPPIVYRLPALRKAIGLSSTTIYKMINENGFPRPIALGSRSVGWLEDEVRAWLATRPRK